MQRLKPVLVSTIILLLACACGQKGPLYLPGAENPVPRNGNEPLEGSEEPEKEDEEDGGSNEENP